VPHGQSFSPQENRQLTSTKSTAWLVGHVSINPALTTDRPTFPRYYY